MKDKKKKTKQQSEVLDRESAALEMDNDNGNSLATESPSDDTIAFMMKNADEWLQDNDHGRNVWLEVGKVLITQSALDRRTLQNITNGLVAHASTKDVRTGYFVPKNDPYQLDRAAIFSVLGETPETQIAYFTFLVEQVTEVCACSDLDLGARLVH